MLVFCCNLGRCALTIIFIGLSQVSASIARFTCMSPLVPRSQQTLEQKLDNRFHHLPYKEKRSKSLVSRKEHLQLLQLRERMGLGISHELSPTHLSVGRGDTKRKSHVVETLDSN